MVENHLNYFVLVLFALLVYSTGEEDVPKYPCELWESVEIGNSSKRFENGSVSFDNVMYPSDLIFYGSSDVDKNVTSLRGCLCSLKICIHKYCALNESYGEEAGCGPGTKILTLDSIKFYEYNSKNGEMKLLEKNDKTNYVIVRYPIRGKCDPDNFSTYGTELDEHFMLENGTLLIKSEKQLRYDIIAYALEYYEEEKKFVPFACKGNTEAARKESTEKKQITSNRLVIGISISIPFLLITFFVYCITPELQNIFGKSILSQVGTLTASYISLLLNHVRPDIVFDNLGKRNSCVFLGYVSHFTLLSNFFWLNIMCFDIWLVFSGFSRPYRCLSKQEEIKRFVKYSGYAWGTPLLICIAIYLTDMSFKTSEPDVTYNISFCLMRWAYAWQFFYIGPLMLTLVTNAALFFGTAFNIYKHKKQSKKVLQSDDNSCSSSVEKERLRLYLKLFVIMGVTWIFEPLSLIFNNRPLWFWRVMDQINSLHGVTLLKLYFKLFLVMGISWICEPVSLIFDNNPRWFWGIFDFINALHGVTMFIIFVCNKRTIRTLNKTFFPSIQIFTSERMTTSTSPKHTSSVSGVSSHKKPENKDLL